MVAACSNSPAAGPSSSILVTPRITVTSVKDDPKSQLLAAIYARLLEEAGLRVARKDPVAPDRAAYLDAIAKGDYQLIPDFSGDLVHHLYSQDGAAPTAATAPTSPNAGHSVEEQLVAIRAQLPDTITVGNPGAAEVKTVIACSEATMKANKDTQFLTYTTLTAVASTIRVGGSADWMANQATGYPVFQQYYGGTFKEVLTIADADFEAFLRDGKVDCVALDSMNPLVTTLHLTILDDDKSMDIANAAVPLINATVATPDVINTLSKLNLSLTSAKLNQLLNQVVNGGTDPVTVANAFMDTLGTTTETSTA